MRIIGLILVAFGLLACETTSKETDLGKYKFQIKSIRFISYEAIE